MSGEAAVKQGGVGYRGVARARELILDAAGVVILGCALAALMIWLASTASAAVRERWSFAWDPHPQAHLATKFKLTVCLPDGCRPPIDVLGGTATGINDVWVDPAPAGDGTATLVACIDDATCSAPSNAVTLDRTTVYAPGNLRFNE